MLAHRIEQVEEKISDIQQLVHELAKAQVQTQRLLNVQIQDTQAFRENNEATIARMEQDTHAWQETTNATIARMEQDTHAWQDEMHAYSEKNDATVMRRDFDTIVFYSDTVVITETKSSPKIKHVENFIEVLKNLEGYFPECAGKEIIPIFASMYIPDNIRTYLTKRNIYTMAMGDRTIERINADEIQKKHGKHG